MGVLQPVLLCGSAMLDSDTLELKHDYSQDLETPRPIVLQIGIFEDTTPSVVGILS